MSLSYRQIINQPLIQKGIHFYKTFQNVVNGNVDLIIQDGTKVYDCDTWDVKLDDGVSYCFFDRQKGNMRILPMVFYCNDTCSSIDDCELLVELTGKMGMSLFVYEYPTPENCLDLHNSSIIVEHSRKAFEIFSNLIPHPCNRVVMMGHRGGCDILTNLISHIFTNDQVMKNKIDSIQLLTPKSVYPNCKGFESICKLKLDVPLNIIDLVHLKSTNAHESMGHILYGKLKVNGSITYKSIGLDKEYHFRLPNEVTLSAYGFNINCKFDNRLYTRNGTIFDHINGELYTEFIESLRPTKRFIDMCITGFNDRYLPKSLLNLSDMIETVK